MRLNDCVGHIGVYRACAVHLSVGGESSGSKVAVCRRAASRAIARLMLPAPLPPLDTRKTRALTTLYAPRKRRLRSNRTAQPRSMLEDVPIKPGLSPFHPLPAIGQRKPKEAKVYVLDLNKNETFRPATVEDRTIALKPLTPLRIHAYERARCNSLEHIDRLDKPQQLIRENTYDVIEPIYLKTRKRASSLSRSSPNVVSDEGKKSKENTPKRSPRSRFRKAALEVAKLSSVPETGKLLCLREKQTFKLEKEDVEDCYRIKHFNGSPTHKLNKLTEIFQNLEVKGHQKRKAVKENSWF